MSELSEFQDVVDWIREGLGKVQFDRVPLSVGGTHHGRQSTSRLRAPVGRTGHRRVSRFGVAGPVLLVAGVALIAITMLVRAGSDSPTGPTDAAAASATTLVGVWPPPIPTVEVPDGATWPCPPVEPRADRILDAVDVPDEIRYLPAGEAYHVDAAWGVDYGPACRRSPALVAVAFDAGDRSAANAALVVWVEEPDDPLSPPLDSAGDPPVGEPPEEIAGSVDGNGFVVRHHPATEWMTERVEMVGVIDGLPVWIQASGITPEDLSAVTRSMTASASTGEVRFAPTDNLEVVRSGPVVAELIDNVVWFVDGTGFDLQVQRAPGFDPYVSALGFTESFTFVDIAGTVGMLAREGGRTGSVMWAVKPGILAMVQSDGTFQELIELAEQLTLAPGL